MSTATATKTRPKRPPKPVSRVGAGLPILEDNGCHLAPTCAGCWLVECWYVMTPETRRQLREALAMITPFVRQADPTIDAGGRPDSGERRSHVRAELAALEEESRMSLHDRLRRLERQHGAGPDAPREYERWIDEPGGMVRCFATGERLPADEFARRGGAVRQVTLDLPPLGRTDV